MARAYQGRYPSVPSSLPPTATAPGRSLASPNRQRATSLAETCGGYCIAR